MDVRDMDDDDYAGVGDFEELGPRSIYLNKDNPNSTSANEEIYFNLAEGGDENRSTNETNSNVLSQVVADDMVESKNEGLHEQDEEIYMNEGALKEEEEVYDEQPEVSMKIKPLPEVPPKVSPITNEIQKKDGLERIKDRRPPTLEPRSSKHVGTSNERVVAGLSYSIDDVPVSVTSDSQQKGTKKSMKEMYPGLFQWLGIMMILGSVLVFIVEIVTIILPCTSYFIGLWVSAVLLLSGVLLLRLSRQLSIVDQCYIVTSIVSVSFTAGILIAGLSVSIALVNFFVATNKGCLNIDVLMIYAVSINLVTVLVTLVHICHHLCKRRVT